MEFDQKLCIIMLKVRGQSGKSEEGGTYDKFVDDEANDLDDGGGSAGNGDSKMDEEQTPDKTEQERKVEKGKDQSSGSNNSRNRAVPMWTSLFKEPSWDNIFAGGLKEMERFCFVTTNVIALALPFSIIPFNVQKLRALQHFGAAALKNLDGGAVIEIL